MLTNFSSKESGHISLIELSRTAGCVKHYLKYRTNDISYFRLISTLRIEVWFTMSSNNEAIRTERFVKVRMTQAFLT